MYKFNAEQTRKELVEWIKNWFDKNGKGCNAVIGLSGGKDSTIMAALCVEALGKDRVIGIGIPDEGQNLHGADNIAKYLGIKFVRADIGTMTLAFKTMFMNIDRQHVLENTDYGFDMTIQTEQNIPPRLRMVTLYAISQSVDGRVMGTCNLSENYIGYFTKYGDGAADVEPLANLTVTELLQIGDVMGLPYEWVHKVPSDGLPHSKSDEEKFGFSYEVLDKYIRGIETPDRYTVLKIDTMHMHNLFKLQPMATFQPNIEE